MEMLSGGDTQTIAYVCSVCKKKFTLNNDDYDADMIIKFSDKHNSHQGGGFDSIYSFYEEETFSTN